MCSPAQKIISLLFDRRYDEAEVILHAERGKARGRTAPRVAGLQEALDARTLDLGTSPAAMRRSLAASYMLAEILREQEFWDEAEVAYDEVVKRSLAMKEPFFSTISSNVPGNMSEAVWEESVNLKKQRPRCRWAPRS